MSARTIPFPRSSGTAATGTSTLLPPPGVAKVSQPSRRYRGLELVQADAVIPPAAPRPSSLQQTQAIVAQVGREIEQQAARQGLHGLHPVLVPRKAPPAPLPAAASQKLPARHFMISLLPAGTR